MNVPARCAVVFVCLAQFSLLAAPRWPNPPIEEVVEPVLRIGTAKEVSVIVELAAPPLLESRGSGNLRTASEALDSLFVQLSTDIERIERRTSSSVTANANGNPLRLQYRMAFAGASVRVSRDSLPEIRALPYVRAVHDDTTLEAYLDSSVPHIGVPQVWEQYKLKGRGIVIAIIDTGVDYTHWALGKGFGPGRKVSGGHDFVNDDADPMDDNGHGTHVAGIAAGGPPLKGIAPEATLLAYKVLAKDGTGQLSWIMAGVERAMDPDGDGDSSDRADIVNMSLGGPLSRNDALVAAVERSIAAGAIFCLAAGNSFDYGAIGSPAAAPSAITVGATDLKDEPATFTSRGPLGGSWLVKPEIAAPGVGIASAFPGGVTRIASGTSMSAPHVSGVAALVLERHPDWTPEEVKAAIVSSARPVFDRSLGTPLTAITSAGAGRLDALRAVGATVLTMPSTITFGNVTKRGVAYSASRTVRFTNRGDASEKLTVRAPALPSGITLTATPAIVTVDPGATAEIQFTLDVGAATIPPNEGQVVFAGTLEVAGVSVVRIPWQVMNGDAVSATYTGTGDFAVYASAGMSPARTWWEGPRTFGAFVLQTRDTDLVVLSGGADGQTGRMIIRERVRVEGPTAVTITPDEAVHKITVAGVTETGEPLSSLGDGRKAWHYVKLPSLGFLTIEYPERLRSLMVSPLDRTEMRTYENIFAGSSRYFGAYRNLRGLKQDETLSITPADWASQKVRLRCETECTVLAGSGGGSPLGWDYEVMPAAEDEWTVHITPQVVPEIDFRMHFMVREKGFVISKDRNPWTYMSPSIRNTNGRLAASTFNRATEGDYMSPDRFTAMEFGDGPVVLRTTMGSRKVDLQPYGPLGENLGSNATKIDAKLTKVDGTKVQMTRSLFVGTFEFQPQAPPPDVYRFTATDTYTVAGKPGKLTQVSVYDTRLYDAPPGLSMLRIETDRGISASGVAEGSRPRLVFAARTSAFVPPNNFYILHSPVISSGTKVSWRRHGTTEWQTLPVTMTGETGYSSDQPGLPGMMFAVPLEAAATETGDVDLKIVVANEYGATTEAVYEPAFVVTPGNARRRAARQ